ncbi:SEC-C motif protein [Planctopirus ephydatiae]|uniref:SEC-C motif protein n=1 Tax=Planctopirus ephydatiae TaxID=2528019 RepID=A0A518GJV7_9PLAN|nr:SEC-C domain-containing protein [Planctopirus ephydatiae]QDV28870.1 SEC-C motif protein [Planctopirus ephydatiae]
MAVDLYQPCPCGSGKKLKFCCAPISDEMSRVDRLIADGQLRPALTALEALDRKVTPDTSSHAWIVTTTSTVHLQMERPDLARDLLKKLLETHTDNDYAFCLYAMASLATDSYEPSRKIIQKAFFRCTRKYPAMCSHLAIGIATVMMSRNAWMATREAMSLALRFAAEDERQDVFLRLLQVDNNPQIPWPLRGAHHLPEFTGSEEHEKEFKKGQKFVQIGCFEAAADTFAALARQLPDAPTVAHAAALCRAWDGNEAEAAAGFHQAARLYTDRSKAVECETLAQLLQISASSDEPNLVRHEFSVSSVSRLLTAFDQHDRLNREERDFSRLPVAPVAVYQIYDRSLKDLVLGEGLPAPDQLPASLGEVHIFDAAPDGSAQALAGLVAYAGNEMETAIALLKEAAGDLLGDTSETNQPIAGVPEQWIELQRQHYFPSRLTPSQIRELEDQLFNWKLNEKWAKTPAAGLAGKSPEEAAKDPAMNIAVTAAIFVLDSFAAQVRKLLDIRKIFQQLQVEPLPLLEVTPETPLANLSVIDFQRLPVSQLSDEQLKLAFNRALLIQHPQFLYDVEIEITRRPEPLDKVDKVKLYRSLGEMELLRNNFQGALHWIGEERKLPAPQGTTEFSFTLQHDMYELNLRAMAPEVTGYDELIQKFVNYYLPKLPQLLEFLESVSAISRKPLPGISASGIVTQTDTTTPGGLWTPDQPQTTASSGGGLWLPGN